MLSLPLGFFQEKLAQAHKASDPPLVLDVDTGRDDAWTILGAVNRFEVAAVVASYGNTTLEKALRNSLDMVFFARNNSRHVSAGEMKMPVYRGEAAPNGSAPAAARAEIERRAAVNGNGICNVELPRNNQKTSDYRDMLSMLREKGPVRYVVCGPLTNLAALVREAGKTGFPLQDYIQSVSIMGGSFDPALPVDFNFRADPQAAAEVIGYFGDKIRLFPYDETKKLVVSQAELAVLTPRSPLGAFNKKVMEAFVKGWAKDGNILLHDPSTLLAFEKNTLFRDERVHVAPDGKIASALTGTPIRRFAIAAGHEVELTRHLLYRYMDLSLPVRKP